MAICSKLNSIPCCRHVIEARAFFNSHAWTFGTRATIVPIVQASTERIVGGQTVQGGLWMPHTDCYTKHGWDDECTVTCNRT